MRKNSMFITMSEETLLVKCYMKQKIMIENTSTYMPCDKRAVLLETRYHEV